ncbi:peptidase S49 [Rickettsiales bacterium]|nr:peptidase S49 [Rickettsiales bacterium]
MNNKQPARLADLGTKIKAMLRKKPAVAVIRLSGIIKQSAHGKDIINAEILDSAIEKAFNKIPNCKAVALLVNSPGGSPVQSEIIANRIIVISKQKKIPVLAFAEDVAASGGYYILCAGDEIYASASSIIGSIGVISAGFGFVEMIKKIGIQRRVYAEGENKSLLDPFVPEKEDDISILKDAQKDVHDSFAEFVKKRRGEKLISDEKELFSGMFWSGKKAKKLGLVDDLVEDYKTFLKRRFGNNTKFVKLNKPKGFLSRRFGMECIAETLINKIQEITNRDRFGL